MTKQLEKMNLIEFNGAYNKTTAWFFSFPEKEVSLNDLSEALKISKTTARRVVNQLVKKGFLKIETIGKIWRISCDKNHQYNYSRKIGYNLTMIYESGILREIHKKISNPRAIILFGSYRKGDDNEKSDIDIAIEVLGNEEVQLIELGIIPEFGFRKNVVVNLYVFTKNKIDLNLFSNITNGIILEGFLEVKP